MDNTPLLSLPLLANKQALQTTFYDEAMKALDTLVMLSVLDRDLSSPPASPDEGDRYIVKAPGSGDAAWLDDHVVVYRDGHWIAHEPRPGWSCYVQDESALLAFDGAAWQPAIEVFGAAPAAPRGHIHGLTLSNNSGDPGNDIDIAAGECASDETMPQRMVLPALTKRLDAGWAAGTNQGMRHSAAAITDATYHIYAVGKANGTEPDIYAHTSTTIATVLTALQAETGGSAYVSARRIGSIVRLSGAIKAFIQSGDDFFWKAGGVLDVNATNPGSSAVTRTLTVPTGIVVDARVSILIDAITSSAMAVYLSPLDVDDVACDASNISASIYDAGGTDSQAAVMIDIRTNTSGQIRSRCQTTGASDSLRIATQGWCDTRGRLS